MRLGGWRFAGDFPDLSKFVVAIAPHTSNWDFLVALAAKWAIGIEVVWIGKREMFRWPVAPILRSLGGIGVDRFNAQGIVQRVVDEFAARPRMVFVLAPEGTRKPVPHWRSGYWHVAHDARVQIVPVALDFKRKTLFVGPPQTTTESLEDDERRLQKFFAGVSGKRR